MSDRPVPARLRARPLRDGVLASTAHLPQGAWRTLLDCLCDHFPDIAPERWRERMDRGLVLDEHGRPIEAGRAYRPGVRVHYFREVADEPAIPFDETIVHADAHLIVADKPSFLPVVPAGRHVRETLLARLIRRFDNPDLVPLHRIDRATAGLVLFSADRHSRAHYQALFRERAIVKHYEALAPALPELRFPLTRCSRLVAGEPFPRMREAPGTANSESRIDVLDRGRTCWRYLLMPITGKKHQLRVHMAALGAPIVGDDLYQGTAAAAAQDHADPPPLQLLARGLAFDDPLDGRPRLFRSERSLDGVAG